MENSDIIDGKYSILQKIGFGLTSNVYKVKEISGDNIYAVKVFTKLFECYEREIEILNELKNLNHEYIVNLIDNGKGSIISANKLTDNIRYIVLEYAPKKELGDYIYYKKEGFKEKHSKVIFSKILKGVKEFHTKGICHRDLKLSNILLDKNYKPKICDFGFATFNTGKLSGECGTPGYMAPEMDKSYDGFKVDIFSLGVILFNLVTGKFGFSRASKSDILYRNLIIKHYHNYWNLLSKQVDGVSEEFKKLYTKMVSYFPKERPSIDDILNDDWMKEIRELNEEEFKKIEDEIIDELYERESTIKEHHEQTMKTNAEDPINQSYNRGIGDNNIKYLDLNLKPKYAKTANLINYIKIEGDIDPIKFMNLLANNIKDKFEDNCSIYASKKSPKFNITITEEEKEDEIPQEFLEEFKKLGIDDNEKQNKNKECILQIKIFESYNGGFLLRFVKKSGDLYEYNKILDKICEIIKSLL